MKQNYLPQDNEHFLIEELKNDSYKAFDRIYQLYAKRLYAFCLQYIKIREDAEEVVEDVFVHLWEMRKEIKQEETLKPLLFIMTKNYLINAYRSQANSPIYEDYVNYQNILSAEDSFNIEYDDFVKHFKIALRNLSPTQQKVIELSKIKLYGNREIAEKLCLSEQTVKNQLSLGLKALKKELGKNRWIVGLLFLVN